MNSAVAFAAPSSFGAETLILPGGSVEQQEVGRIYAIAEWVVAVGVSETAFLVARQRPQPQFPSLLREQLAGFLVGRGAKVVRTDIRFPLDWQRYGTLQSTIRFWLNHFLEEGWKRRLFITMPAHVAYPIVLPLAALGETATNFWNEVSVLTDALAQDDPRAMETIRPNLAEVARVWEQFWNGTINHTAKNSTVKPDDWAAVHDADRAWLNVMNVHLGPYGYAVLPDTMARLL